MFFKHFAIFLFSTACFFANGMESSSIVDIDTTRFLLAKSSSKSSAQKAHKSAKYSLPNFNVDDPKAKGLILKFHRWPNEKEKAVILKKMNKAGLKKESEVQRFKVWTFEWNKWHKGAEAQKLCKKFSGISSLKYCEPDYIVSPAAQKQETIAQRGTNYIMLRNWVNNRGLSIVNAIGFLNRKNIPILQIDNPEVPALRAAGKSYSPTIHAIPNTSET